MADLININTEKRWSAGAWIVRFVLRAIQGFLPRYDASHISQQFEAFQNGARVDLTDFSSSDMQVIYSAARQAYEHISTTGVSSDLFSDPEFTPSDGFFRRFCAKFEEFIRVMEKDTRLDIAAEPAPRVVQPPPSDTRFDSPVCPNCGSHKFQVVTPSKPMLFAPLSFTGIILSAFSSAAADAIFKDEVYCARCGHRCR